MMLMFRRCLTNVKSREQCEHISLDRCDKDLDQADEQYDQCRAQSNPIAHKHERKRYQAQQHDVPCRNGNKQTNEQRNRFCKYSDDLHHQNNRTQNKWQSGRPENVAPVILITTDIGDNECYHRQCQRYSNIAGQIARTGDKTEQIAEKYEEEQREKKGEIPFVAVTDIRFCNLVAHKKDYRFEE